MCGILKGFDSSLGQEARSYDNSALSTLQDPPPYYYTTTLRVS